MPQDLAGTPLTAETLERSKVARPYDFLQLLVQALREAPIAFEAGKSLGVLRWVFEALLQAWLLEPSDPRVADCLLNVQTDSRNPVAHGARYLAKSLDLTLMSFMHR
jgi:hypothetical protein